MDYGWLCMSSKLYLFLLVLILVLYYSQFIYSSISRFKGNSENVIRICQGDNIALTFDDGPKEITPKILDILKANNVTATFFLRGDNIKKYPEIFKRIENEGHIIGTHTYSHKKLTSLNELEIRKEIDKSFIYFRPPYGSYDREVIKITKKYGIKIVLYSYSSIDWILPGFLINLNTYNIRKGDIVLFHDLKRTVKQLDKIIKRLKSKGYNLVSIEQCKGV